MFYTVEQLPAALQVVAWCLPLTSVVSLARTVTLGFPLAWHAVPILAGWLVVVVVAARRTMMRRLVK